MLYRGMRLERHIASNGVIMPGGSLKEVVPLADGTWCRDGKFTYGHSEDNAVRAHHIHPSKWGGCFVSTSRSKEVAHYFATSDELGNEFDGVVYHLDEALFDQYGVVAKEFDDPLYPDELEVSIRAAHGGEIPLDVIVRVETFVTRSNYSRRS